MHEDILARFVRYVKIDTQSDPNSKTFPSTEKQKDLGRVLVKELLDLGLTDAALDEYGYVYATLPSNVAYESPTICWCSHMDTSPDCSGTDVKPLVHTSWDGRDIVLPDDPSVVIRMDEHPDLPAQVGNDIVTASGTTLLGADNKAGVAAIMGAVRHLTLNPNLPHGNIRILFTPDEEIGHGVDYVDMQKLGADFGYTVDGESLGSFENETFSADAMTIQIYGVSAHPGYAYKKMENAIKIAGKILAALPPGMGPERTRGRKGFVHPLQLSGTLEKAEITFIIRDFDTKKLADHEQMLRDITNRVLQSYPNSRATFEVHEQYRNMFEILKDLPKVTEFGKKALQKAGLKPKIGAIRGGTDGSRLTFKGLPCPNLFAGEHAFHSKQEWVSVQDMVKSAETLVHLAGLWSKERK